ncbi:heterogeneous nuclear ribonucleoprotein R-like [Chenopodium quinoa]|uniref:heterogeneous nuclear ribonucleoprotein R-like n=1 Tax=Chenopodium quinoa TaxID=63459 RepID=UPI000B7958C2|nr:heterogeneous nuclear ribonucleoprotein R-like [Chenopodium quinoa]
MPPKGRPRRAAARKKPPPPENPTISAEPSEEIHADKQQPLTEVPLPDNDVVLAPSSETLIAGKPEPPENQTQSTETAVKSQDDVVLGSEETKDKDTVGKAKKVVKKTVRVVKKVIKRVPKKVVKSEIDSQIDKVDSISKPEFTVSACVNKEELKSAGKCVQLKEEINNSVSNFREEESKSTSSSGAQLKVENHDLNSNSTISAKVGVQLKAENHDSDVLVCKMEEEESKVEVNEKKGILEEVRGENVVEKGSELMEIESVSNNEGNVEERGGECGKESEGLVIAEGAKLEESKGEEVEDGQGERKLFRGELEAMERKKRRKTEIFIGRLDKDVKEDDIRKVFAEVGEIVDLRLILNSKTGKKFAFLRYASAEEARRALDKFAKVEICGKECGATPVEGNDTIFLGNIDKKWKYEDVVSLLNKIGIGNIDKVTVMVDSNNSECNRGFAFVEFLTINDAQLAYTKLQEKDVFGKNKKLKVAWAEPLKELDEEEMLKVKTVYAEFIPSSWDEMKLRDTFKKFGEIDEIVLARNLKTTKRKDFAFISFKTREAAIKCIESFGHDLSSKDESKVSVKVSLAKPKPKVRPIAKPFAKEVPQTMPRASHSKIRPSEPLNWIHRTVPRHGIQVPDMSSTNVELVQLLREQASWRSPHASLSSRPMDLRYSNPSLSGRKRQYPEMETDPLHGISNRYPQFHLDAPYSVASSSQNIMPPNVLTNPMAYHQRHGGYTSGSLYGARNYANNVEIRDKAHESSFRRY